jgi:hypothetical protein
VSANFDDDLAAWTDDKGRTWVECWQCGGEGTTGHDCGEDCCCCLNPYDNVVCDICHGKGAWMRKPPADRGDEHE